MTDADRHAVDEDDVVVVTHEEAYAAGVPAVSVSLRRGVMIVLCRIAIASGWWAAGIGAGRIQRCYWPGG